MPDGWDCLATACYDMEVHKFQNNLCNFARIKIDIRF
jgi:hypothetical protein